MSQLKHFNEDVANKYVKQTRRDPQETCMFAYPIPPFASPPPSTFISLLFSLSLSLPTHHPFPYPSPQYLFLSLFRPPTPSLSFSLCLPISSCFDSPPPMPLLSVSGPHQSPGYPHDSPHTYFHTAPTVVAFPAPRILSSH